MAEAVKMLSSVGKFVMEVDMFPVFFFAHFALGNILVREDSKHLGPKFQQKHPFTSWLCSLLTSLSGAFVASFLFGDPLVDILQETTLIGFHVALWYVMNYSPYNALYNVMKHPIVLLPLSVLQEFFRLRFVYTGMQAAVKVYPNAPLIILLGGIIKGNGYGFIKIVERLLRGHWNPKTSEFLELSYFNKSGVVASCVFLLHHYKLLNAPIEFVYLGNLGAFIVGRLIIMLGGIGDPMAVVGAPLCKILFGSWEEEKPSKSEAKDNQKHNKGDGNKNNNKAKNGSSKKQGDKKTN